MKKSGYQRKSVGQKPTRCWIRYVDMGVLVVIILGIAFGLFIWGKGSFAGKAIGTNCVDTDATNNVSIKGRVTGALGSLNGPVLPPYYDSCYGPSLRQVDCGKGGVLQSTTTACPSGKTCNDGVCLPGSINVTPSTCFDTDPTDNVSIKGVVNGSLGGLNGPILPPQYDSCEGGKLKQVSCGYMGAISSFNMPCPNGTACLSGICK